MIFAGRFDEVGGGVGYTQASMLYLAALAEAGRRDVTIMPIQGRPIHWDSVPPWAKKAALLGKAENISRDVGLVHLTPDALAYFGSPAQKVTFGLTVVETDRVPAWLCNQLRKSISALIVPCEHNAEAFRAGGFDRPIHIVPHPMHTWKQDAAQVLQWRDNARCDSHYTFLYVGTWNDRKNPEGVLRAYCRAFPKPGRARLLIKVTGPVALEGFIEHIVLEERGSVTRDDIHVYLKTMPEHEISWLYGISDCFVSLHRGEGWGLGLHQAAVMGKPVIYTDWSAPAEYLRGLSHLPVPFDMVPASRMGGNMPFWLPGTADHLQWAEPRIDEAAAVMRSACESAYRLPVASVDAITRSYGLLPVGRMLSTVLESV